MTLKKKWIPAVWGVGIGVAVASYLWGTSARAGLVSGERVVFTLVIPMAALLACLALSLATSGRDEGPSARS